MKTISYKSKYQPPHIIKDIIKSNINTHLLKPETGSGGSHSVLTTSDEKIIFVSPTRKLVIEKENQHNNGEYPESNIDFLYGGSVKKSKNVRRSEYGHIIMGTINQILKLDVEEFSDYTLIIDELHVMIMSSLYREECKSGFESFAEYFIKKNRCITITATPIKYYPEIFKSFEILKLKKELEFKNVVFTNKNVNNHIKDILINKENLVFFSNNFKMINKVITEASRAGLKDKITTYIGSVLESKVIERHGILQSDNPTIFICSSASVEGIDINLLDCHVVVHNVTNAEYVYSVQNIVQALGRTRNGYKSAIIFNDSKKSVNNNPFISDNNISDTALLNLQDTLDNISNFNYIKDELFKYSYHLYKDTVGIEGEQLSGKHRTLQDSIINFMSLDKQKFEDIFSIVSQNTYINKTFYGYDMQIFFGLLCAKICRILNLDNECMEILSNTIKLSGDKVDLNKQLTLFINCIKKAQVEYTSVVENNEDIEKLSKCGGFGVFFYRVLSSKPPFFDKIPKIHSKRCDVLSTGVQNLLEDLEIIKNLYYPSNSVRKYAKKYKNYSEILSQLKQISSLYVRNFNSGIIRTVNREYSALVNIPMDILTKTLPYGIIEADIKSAFPTFVSAIVGDKRNIDVYKIIAKNKGISRSKAKTLYNTFLNSTDENISSIDRLNFFKNECQYTDEQSAIIIDINSSRGKAFEIFTNYERKIIEKLRPIIRDMFDGCKIARRHDSIVVFNRKEQWENRRRKNEKIEITINTEYEGKGITIKTVLQPEMVSK